MVKKFFNQKCLGSFYKRSLLFAKLIISILILWLLVHTAQIKLDLFISTLHQPIWFVCIIIMFLLMVFVSASRFYILNVAQGIQLSLQATIVPTYLAATFNNLLPGAIGGDFIRLYYLFKRIPKQKQTILLSIFFDRLMGLIGVFIVISYIAISKLRFFNQQPELFYLLLPCLVFCFGVLITLMIVMTLAPWFLLNEWLRNKMGHFFWIKSFLAFLDAIRAYQLPKEIIIKCTILSIFMQFLIAATVCMIAKSMGFPAIPFSDYLLAAGVTQIVNLIPITPGGIGIGEIAFSNILLLLNPGITAAFATIFLAYRLISSLAYLPGIFFYIPEFLFSAKKNLNHSEEALL